MIDYNDAWSVDEKTLFRLWEWATNHDVSGQRMKSTPPSNKREIITQLVWIGIVGSRTRG